MELVATTVRNVSVAAAVARAEGAATITTFAATIISAADRLQMLLCLQWRRPGSRSGSGSRRMQSAERVRFAELEAVERPNWAHRLSRR